jgi:hypothetical protein
MSQAVEANRRRWAQIIGRQRTSGLGVDRFCRREGLAPSTFFAWRRRLGGAGGRDDPDGAVHDEDSTGGAFVEVVAAGDAAEAGPMGVGVSASGVEICLFNGRRIGVARWFDQETLCRVLAVLERTPVPPSAEQGTMCGKGRT